MRKFLHPKSVFKEWQPDRPETIERCTINDMPSMKIGKLCKSTDAIVALEKMITKLMPQLKQYHLDLLCQTSIPPYISELDFVGFYRDCRLPDQNLIASSIDLIYR